jgi:hypothetical protein
MEISAIYLSIKIFDHPGTSDIVAPATICILYKPDETLEKRSLLSILFLNRFL